ncbi:hypothetical protein [Undibacterium fentianense]|uniref:VCBS repeat-containing protein n=1 Tax=Undibacterium fentianense TaxID=2828728 RepID=A0A941E2L8_9BURK|nr:hypothetical protein [Undibacterium fentianense]MBR7800092.1 hypothetical protein [Undibacterium fentianense]
MKIASSDIQLQAQHAVTQRQEVQEKTRIWKGNQRPDFDALEKQSRSSSPQATSTIKTQNTAQADTNLVYLSSAALKAQYEESPSARASQSINAIRKIQDDIEQDPRMLLIRYLVEQLTGQTIDQISMADLEPDNSVSDNMPNTAPPNARPQQSQTTPPRQGWGVEIDIHQRVTETEKTQFQASGVITTADHRQIQIDLQFELVRSHTEESHQQLRAGDAKLVDPLALNFSGNSAQLTSQKFSFDLNADGKQDSISFVKGAGFVVLDKNGDGKVNNGSELFGPGTGNGFNELAAFDQDGNQWIDENDAVFQRLQVWTKDAQGKDQLQSLKQANVGALYLGNASTPFDVIDSQQQLNGQIRSSGIWLSEDGQVKSLQQVDLVV